MITPMPNRHILMLFTLMLGLTSFARAQGSFIRPQFSVVSNDQTTTIEGIPFKIVTEKILNSNGPEGLHARLVTGSMTQENFNKLRTAFLQTDGTGYSPDREYEITDFLSPMIKALDGRQFIAGKSRNAELDKWIDSQDDDTDKSEESHSISTVTNCWSTTLEFLRNDPKNLNIYYPSMAVAAKVFTDASYFAEINTSQLKYGDVVFISNFNFQTDELQAQHAAVYIGADFFFEKTGSASKFLYRLVHKSEIEKSYPSETYTWKYLRHTEKPLPSPSYFSIAQQEPDVATTVNPDLRSKLSVEISFGQGLVGYGFVSISTQPLP